ncbi:MAG: SIMPL domain-containing protein [Methylophaga sp.]
MSKQLLFFVTLLFSLNALADNDLHYNLINLSTNAKTEISNDEMSAYLQILRSGSDATKLSAEVNKNGQEALRIAKSYDAVKVQTQGYQTQPIYNDGKISSWQVSQQLRLESSDFTQMSELLAELQGLGNIQSMQFAISDDRLETTRQDLAKQAIDKFQAQAAAIQKQFNASSYRLVNLSVNQGGYSPRYMEASNMRMDSMSKAAPVAIEAGSNEVSVDVHGQIQLITDSSAIN